MNKTSAAKVYTILHKLMRRHYRTYPLIMLDVFIRELREAGQKALMEDTDFPIEFFYEMSNTVILWFMKGYPGLTENRIGSMLQAVWAFHKECLERPDGTDTDMDYLFDRANVLAEDIEQVNERALYIAVMHEYDRATKHSDDTQPNSGVRE